jgi:hypothetical protein
MKSEYYQYFISTMRHHVSYTYAFLSLELRGTVNNFDTSFVSLGLLRLSVSLQV